MNEIATRQNQPDIRQEWVTLFGEILHDIARIPGPTLDDFEKKAFAHALKPLAERILSGQLSPTAAAVWKFRFAIRSCKFRPTYDDVTGFLHTALGIEVVPGHVAEERQVRTAPQPLQIEGSNTARDRARKKLNELITRTGTDGKRHSHGPEVWKPAYPNMPDPLENVPAELHKPLIEQARQELLKSGKGLHPNHIRVTAGNIYRQERMEPQPEENEPDEDIFAGEPALVMA